MKESRAPWTEEQVESLNEFQESGVFHPFTCGTEGCRQDLVAASDGWHCSKCGLHRQDWAHEWMSDDSWRKALRPGDFWKKVREK
jgi:hypothetical protein